MGEDGEDDGEWMGYQSLGKKLLAGSELNAGRTSPRPFHGDGGPSALRKALVPTTSPTRATDNPSTPLGGPGLEKAQKNSHWLIRQGIWSLTRAGEKLLPLAVQSSKFFKKMGTMSHKDEKEAHLGNPWSQERKVPKALRRSLKDWKRVGAK